MTGAVEAAQARLAVCEVAMREAHANLRSARLEACPVAVGGVVLDRRGKPFRVAAIDTRWGYDIKGNPKNKDGSWSKRAVHVYRWTVLEAGR